MTTVVHYCPKSGVQEEFYSIMTQNVSAQHKTVLYKCQSCGRTLELKEDVYRRNNPRRSSVMNRERERNAAK
jgi:predicted RNA-binding Zn-ribbon protein involved in translation (DUF1610 family)